MAKYGTYTQRTKLQPFKFVLQTLFGFSKPFLWTNNLERNVASFSVDTPGILLLKKKYMPPQTEIWPTSIFAISWNCGEIKLLPTTPLITEFYQLHSIILIVRNLQEWFLVCKIEATNETNVTVPWIFPCISGVSLVQLKTSHQI